MGFPLCFHEKVVTLPCKSEYGMCKITLSYNENSALARYKLAVLLSSGLFTQIADLSNDDDEEKERYREERNAFFRTSRNSMASVIAKNV